MKKNVCYSYAWFLVCFVLLAALALFTTGCSHETGSEKEPVTPSSAMEQDEGSLAKSFTFQVVDQKGKTKTFLIETQKETVGDALLEQGLILGEEGPYGLYVKTVNGITVDYDTDGSYWAFYENGEYAVSGVDTTTIQEGAMYSFKVES